MMQQMSTDMSNALNNLASATIAKNETMEELLKMNHSMSHSIAALTKENKKHL